MSYKEKTDQMNAQRMQILELRQKIRELQSTIEPQEVEDYGLETADGTVKLSELFGDKDTLLPEGLKVWSCLDRDALAPEILEQISAATAHWGDRQSGFEARLFCPEGQIPKQVGRHPDPDAGKDSASGN